MFSISLKFTPMSSFTLQKLGTFTLILGRREVRYYSLNTFVTNNSELGTRQLFRLTTTRQRNNGKELQGQVKIRQMLRFRCLHKVATTNKDIMQ